MEKELKQINKWLKETKSEKAVNYYKHLDTFSADDMTSFAKWKDEQKESLEELVNLVIEWGRDKDILKKENSYKQFAKIVEEVGEIGKALGKNDEPMLIDAIGDSFVTIIIEAEQNGLNTYQCLKAAYNEIKDRTGKTVNGTFFKD